MNILFISLDTCRADHLSCYGYPRRTSPNIEALAADGTVFWNCISECAHTVPAYTSMFSGLHPVTHGIVGTLWCLPNENNELLDDTVRTMPEMLADAGYTTAAVDNLVTTMAFHPAWFGRGYRYYMNPAVRAEKGKVRADWVNELALPWLKQHGREQFFLFLHYWDPHQGYSPPAPFDSAFPQLGLPPVETLPSGEDYVPRCGKLAGLDERARALIDRYDGEILYVDDRVGQVFSALKELGVYDDTLIVVNGDHGDDMAEHNCHFEHREVYDHTLRVPLIYKLPKTAQGGQRPRIDALVQHQDLTPTILDLAGVAVDHAFDGQSLRPLLQGQTDSIRDHVLSSGCWIYADHRWKAAEIGVRTAEWKLVRRGNVERVLPCERRIIGLIRPDRPELFTTLPERELYHLTEDLYEQKDILSSRPQEAASLETLLGPYMEADLFIG